MIVKKCLIVALLAFSVESHAIAMEPNHDDAKPNRTWPRMEYSGRDGNAHFALISIKEVGEDKFAKFLTKLLSTDGVYNLYENGEPYDERVPLVDGVYADEHKAYARARRIAATRFERTTKWFNGNNDFFPWAVIQRVSEPVDYVGILGVHFHATEKNAQEIPIKEYGALEICYACEPQSWGNQVISNAFRTYAQAFSSQLEGLGARFNRVIAPISPVNLPSLKLVNGLGFTVGESTSPDAQYISGYFPNIKPTEDEKSRLLDLSGTIAQKIQDNKKLTLKDFELSEADHYILRAFRVVLVLPKVDFFKQYGNK